MRTRLSIYLSKEKLVWSSFNGFANRKGSRHKARYAGKERILRIHSTLNPEPCTFPWGAAQSRVLWACMFYLLVLVVLNGCEARKIPAKVLPDSDHYLRLQPLIDRIGSLQFNPAGEERMYPFTFAFRKVEGGKIIRQGEGFVLLHETLWCLVQHWQDNQTDKPGRRMIIFDRRKGKFEAEVRHWPEGNLKQRWNNWTCIRVPVPDDEELGLYHCEYYYPDGTEHVTRDLKEWDFYGSFIWNEDGLLERMTRFSNSSVRYRYEGLKVKRVEYYRGETIVTFTEFTYK